MGNTNNENLVFMSNILEVQAIKKNKKRSWKLLYEKNRDGYLSYERFHRNPENFRFNQFLDIGKCTNALFLFKENLPELRKQFQFNENILEAAQNVLQQLKVTKPTKKIVYVGIHLDYIRYSHLLILLLNP